MRILFPILSRYPSLEAPAVQVANMAQAFAELGHEVTLVAPAPDPDLARSHPGAAEDPSLLLGFVPRFRTVQLSRGIHRGQSYLHALRIAALAGPTRTDLVFSRNLRACLIPALRGVPTVFEAHTLSSLTGLQERLVLRWLARSRGLRAVVAISGALGDDLVTELGLDPALVVVAHDAVRPGRGDEDGDSGGASQTSSGPDPVRTDVRADGGTSLTVARNEPSAGGGGGVGAGSGGVMSRRSVSSSGVGSRTPDPSGARARTRVPSQSGRGEAPAPGGSRVPVASGASVAGAREDGGGAAGAVGAAGVGGGDESPIVT
jgi:hypothetical protein